LRYEPLEGYLLYQSEHWDVLAGQFIESWGIADAFNPLDVLNRRDFAVNLFDPPPRGSLGGRVRVHFEGGDVIGQPSVGAYVIPLWRATDFPTENNRFSFGQSGLDFNEDGGIEPSTDEGIFSALRFEHTLDTSAFSADMQYIGARGPEPFPFVAPNAAFQLVPQYFGVWVAGGGFRAVPNASWWSKLTLKAEVAYKKPYAFDTAPLVLPEDYTQFSAGFDRTINRLFAGKDQLTLTLEYLGEVGADDLMSRFRPFDTDIALRLFWEAGNFARTSVELRSIVDVTDGEWIGEAVLQTQLRPIHDNLNLELSALYIRPGDVERSLFRNFPDPSHASARLTFDF
jgi:hypothetical protein